MWSSPFLKTKSEKMKVRTHLKHALCLIFIITFLLSIILIHYPVSQNLSDLEHDYYSVIPPYRIHLNDTCNFFKDKYDSVYSDLLYYRRGDTDGNILDEAVYSIDNLLFYKTAEKYSEDLSGSETYSSYIDLKSTNYGTMAIAVLMVL